jgi:UDP-N-acetylmuramoyl-L-alanyl-D-glutamate--2,6-diaminopimelate ligase
VTPAADPVVVRGVPLEEVLRRIDAPQLAGDASGVVVRSVTFDHRDVVPGALHCCLPGANTDGRRFAAAARRAGAVALLSEAPIDWSAEGQALHGEGATAAPVAEVVVAAGTARAAMANAACALEGDPAGSLSMVGVTGTNGKTTVVHLVRSVLEGAGRPTEAIGTLSGARTTPESPLLQRMLAEARDSGKAAVAMEVTSHALVQHRVDGIRYDVAAFTNLSQDHLDYHGDMASYFAAKASLFTPERCVVAVVNADDPYGRRLLHHPLVPTRAFSMADAEDLEVGPMSSRFRWRGHEVQLGLGGGFNVANALAAAAVAHEAGIGAHEIASGLSAAEPVAGRFEPVANELGLAVVVDYAHTPDGLASVLGAARHAVAGLPAARVIVVFGCGGNRDRGKRPMMGHVATTLADVAILTSDNPRDEDPAAIMDEVRSGCDGTAQLVVEEDRRAAIAVAVRTAKPGDVVVVAGKGHETTQEVAGRLLPFDDREVARGLLEELAGR